MSTFYRNIFASLLLIVFCFYITPKEVLHIFTNHHDTEHHSVNKTGTHFEKQHHHCELLKIDQQFFASSFEIPFYDFSKLELFFISIQKSINHHFLSSFIASNKQLRAPPFSVV